MMGVELVVAIPGPTVVVIVAIRAIGVDVGSGVGDLE